MNTQTNYRPKGLIIAIDGPSGAGKSTITRSLAKQFGYLYIDTGAMFRALALAVQRAGVSSEDDRVLEVCRSCRLEFIPDAGNPRITLNGEDVSGLIRTPEISLLTSGIASRKPVRELLLSMQREMGKDGGVILEGRDIGTVVFPDADLKFFLSASAEERGRRRYLELQAAGQKVDLEQTIAEVIARDRQDESRAHAPLRQAEDAIVVDSTCLTIGEVVDAMAQVIDDRLQDAAKRGKTMEIILAKQAGFCFGVKRATKMAFEAADKGGETFTLGPIIHSPQVVQRLEQMGVRVLKELGSLERGTIIIRSHGVTSEELEEAVAKELEIVDATCPFVKKAQEHVQSLSAAGYDVVVVGDADHPEVQGIVSYAGGNVYVVASGEEAARLPKMAKIGVVAQTTQSFENLESVVRECLGKAGEIRVYHTICDATAVRQEAAKELAREVDCMIVIGGFNSANTKRLAEVCAELQPRTYHIETAQELDSSWFDGVKRVGVTAGASTPKWLIDEVMERIGQFDCKNG